MSSSPVTEGLFHSRPPFNHCAFITSVSWEVELGCHLSCCCDYHLTNNHREPLFFFSFLLSNYRGLVRVLTEKLCFWGYVRTGESRGFAFVRYKYADEAQKAVERLDGLLLFPFFG